MKKVLLFVLVLAVLLTSGCFFGFGRQESKESAPPQEEVKEISFIVYRAAADGSERLLAEKITMRDNGRPVPENALNALLTTKPAHADMDNVVPAGTKLLNLRVEKDGTAFADFSHDIAKRGSGSYNEFMMTGAIVNTLTEFPEIKRVQIMVEGKKVITLGGHMDLEDPLERNTTLLQK